MGNFIEHIEITNFKSIRHQVIDGCKRINVFIGYPNVGKSNILEAIGLYGLLTVPYRETFSFDKICRVRHFSELYFNQNYRGGAAIRIRTSSTEGMQLAFNNGDNSSILTLDFNKLVFENNRITAQILDPEKDNRFRVELPNFYINYNHAGLTYKHVVNQVRKYQYVNESVVHLINNFPLSIPSGENLLDVLLREPELRRSIAVLLKKYELKMLLDRSSEGIMLIKELEDGSVLKIPYHQIADTLKRLIFYKAAIVSNDDAILLFEEPESHMFPPYIGKFTSDIWYKKSNQYFIGTHSPFVLNDFLENAREELAIYIVDFKNGETIIKRMTDEEIHEAYQYGMDLFFNLESYLD